MKLNYESFRISSFSPIVLPEKPFQDLAKKTTSDLVFFHPVDGNILFSSSFRTAWSGITFGKTKMDFLSWIKGSLIDAEESHFNEFIKKMGKDPESGDSFLFSEHVTSSRNGYGVQFLDFRSGSLALLIQGEGWNDFKNKMALAREWKTPEVEEIVNGWVREMETDHLVSLFLRMAFDEGFRSFAFSRPVLRSESDDRSLLVYRYNNKTWFREFDSINSPIHLEKRRRHAGRKKESEESILLDLSVFLGGFLRLGVITTQHEGASLFSFDRFLRRASSALCEEASTLSGIVCPFSKFWTGHGFNLSVLEEMVQAISPTDFLRFYVLPYSAPSETPLYEIERDLVAINLMSYTSDILFNSSSKKRGVVFVGDIGEAQALFVRKKLMAGVKVLEIHRPVTVDSYIRSIRKAQESLSDETSVVGG